MCDLGGDTLRAFGYDPMTQNFPSVRPHTNAHTHCDVL